MGVETVIANNRIVKSFPDLSENWVGWGFQKSIIIFGCGDGTIEMAFNFLRIVYTESV